MTRPQFFCHECGHSIDDYNVSTITLGDHFNDAYSHTARKWVGPDLTNVQHVVLRRKAVTA